MNRVRQVSIVDLEVALTVLVTERPKKLKPLRLLVTEDDGGGSDIPNANHNQDT